MALSLEKVCVSVYPVLPPDVLEAAAGDEEDLDDDVDEKEDGAEGVEEEDSLPLLLLPPAEPNRCHRDNKSNRAEQRVILKGQCHGIFCARFFFTRQLLLVPLACMISFLVE